MTKAFFFSVPPDKTVSGLTQAGAGGVEVPAVAWGCCARRVPGRAGLLSHRCTCNATVPPCRWQTAAETHSLASRCLRCFSQRTLLRWAPAGSGVRGSGPTLLRVGVLSLALPSPAARCRLPRALPGAVGPGIFGCAAEGQVQRARHRHSSVPTGTFAGPAPELPVPHRPRGLLRLRFAPGSSLCKFTD